MKWTNCQKLDGKFSGICGTGQSGFEVCCSFDQSQTGLGKSTNQPQLFVEITTPLPSVTSEPTNVALPFTSSSPVTLAANGGDHQLSTLDPSGDLQTEIPHQNTISGPFLDNSQPSVYNLPPIFLSSGVFDGVDSLGGFNSSGVDESKQAFHPHRSSGSSTFVVNLPEIVRFEEPLRKDTSMELNNLTVPPKEEFQMVFSASTPVVDILPPPPMENLNLVHQPTTSSLKLTSKTSPAKKMKIRRRMKVPQTNWIQKHIQKKTHRATSICAAAMLCVQKSFCTLLGSVSKTRLDISGHDRLYKGVALMSCLLPGTVSNLVKPEDEMVCCRDLKYQEPWPKRRRMRTFSRSSKVLV